MRKRVRILILWIIGGTFLFAIATVLTNVLRSGMTTGSVFLMDAVPAAFVAVCRDPVLIVAFIVVAIVLWVIPWEDLVGHKTEEDEDTNVVRGRNVTSFQRANRRAEAAMKARRATLRRQHRNDGP